jgi:2-enoate reductase
MNDLNIEQLPSTKLIEITESGAVLESGGKRFFKEVENVVLAVGYKSDNLFFEKIKAACHDVYVIGDAKQPANVIDAVRSGYQEGAIV